MCESSPVSIVVPWENKSTGGSDFPTAIALSEVGDEKLRLDNGSLSRRYCSSHSL